MRNVRDPVEDKLVDVLVLRTKELEKTVERLGREPQNEMLRRFLDVDKYNLRVARESLEHYRNEGKPLRSPRPRPDATFEKA
jgi:hypothetical protein